MKYLIIFSLGILFYSCSTEMNKSIALKEASEYIDVNEFETSLEKLDLIIKNFPKFDSAYVERSFVYYCLDKFDYGIEDCNKAIELDYSNLNAYLYRAFNYGGLGNYNLAAKDYSHIIKLGPSENYHLALIERSYLLAFGGQYENAKNDLLEVLKTDSANCEALIALGLYSSGMKDFHKGMNYPGAEPRGIRRASTALHESFYILFVFLGFQRISL